MRILHLEDLIFEKDIDINTILRGIHAKTYPSSIKWDGNPAFVVGKTGSDYFIAFKTGYMKKVPTLFRSEREIRDNIHEPSLAEKMVRLFNKFKDMRIEQIVVGELMFDSTMIDDNNEFQPNTVRYRSEIPASLCVAVHSMNGKRQNHLVMDTKHKIPMIYPSINYDSVECQKIRNFGGLANSHKDKFKRWVNAMIREEIPDRFDVTSLYDFWKDDPFGRYVATYTDEWDILMQNYKSIMLWKNHILSTLKVDYIIQPANGHEHEGIVIDAGSKLIKMVNRHQFSRKNFQRERHGRQSVS